MKLKPYTQEYNKAELLLESILGVGDSSNEAQQIEKLKNTILSQDHDEGYLSQLVNSGLEEYKSTLAGIVDNELQKPQIMQMYDRVVGANRDTTENKTQLFVKALLVRAYIAVFIPDSKLSVNVIVDRLKNS